MSFILTRDLAKQAVEIVRPTIEAFLGSDLTGGEKNLYLVILNPSDGKILYEEPFGSRATTWNHPYAKIARAKGKQCYRTGLTGRKIKTQCPWLIEPGDTRYAGGIIEDGLAIAASGLLEHFDEMISWMVFNAIQALCRDFMAKMSDDVPDFFVHNA